MTEGEDENEEFVDFTDKGDEVGEYVFGRDDVGDRGADEEFVECGDAGVGDEAVEEPKEIGEVAEGGGDGATVAGAGAGFGTWHGRVVSRCRRVCLWGPWGRVVQRLRCGGGCSRG